MSNPYVVHSTKGFLYLMNYEVSNISLTNKYLELACDIVLNDETFDKDGNVYGGDGVVYNWDNKGNKIELSFNGNNHIIKGFYVRENDEVVGDFSNQLLGGKIKLIENVNVDNVYVYGGGTKIVSVLAKSITTISKVKMHSGNVIGMANVASAFAIYSNYIYYSINYVNVHSYYQGASGFVYSISKEMKNCVNYGNIYIYDNEKSENGRGAGMTQNMSADALIENCENYGNIDAGLENGQSGGIAAWAKGTIKGCKNYGYIKGWSALGGIVGFKPEGNLTILLCENYGKIISSRNEYMNGGILGCFCDADIYETQIRDCYTIVTTGSGIVGTCNNGKPGDNPVLSVTRCKADIVSNDEENIYCLFGNLANIYYKAYFSNIEINVIGNGIKRVVLIYNKVGIDRDLLNIKNVIINISNKNTKFSPNLYNDKGNLKFNLDGFIVNQAGNRCYYGADFSGFYCDWKSGKIGLKALDGKGFYQGVVSESILQEKGFVKKVFPA